jgi:hypothetical protein
MSSTALRFSSMDMRFVPPPPPAMMMIDDEMNERTKISEATCNQEQTAVVDVYMAEFQARAIAVKV